MDFSIFSTKVCEKRSETSRCVPNLGRHFDMLCEYVKTQLLPKGHAGSPGEDT